MHGLLVNTGGAKRVPVTNEQFFKQIVYDEDESDDDIMTPPNSPTGVEPPHKKIRRKHRENRERNVFKPYTTLAEMVRFFKEE